MAIGLIPIITTAPTIIPTLTGLIAIMIGEVARMELGIIPIMTLGATAHGMEEEVGEEAAARFVETAGFVHDPIACFRAADLAGAAQADANA